MWGFFLVGLLTLSAFEAFPTDSNKPYLQSQLSKYGFEHTDIGVPAYDSVLTMDTVSALMAKRNQRKADHLKKQQHRRGSFDSLLAGNGFGRNARSDPALITDILPAYNPPARPSTANLQSHQGADLEDKVNRDLVEALISCATGREHGSHMPKAHQSTEGKSTAGLLNRDGGGGAGNSVEYQVDVGTIGRVEYQSPPFPYMYRRFVNATIK